MVGEIIGALVALIIGLLGILSGVIAWLTRKLWDMKTKDVAENSARIRSLEEQMRGVNEADSGFTGNVQRSIQELSDDMEALQYTIEDAEDTRRRRHMEVRMALKKVIEVIDDSDLNGDLPEPDDLED